MELKVTDTNYCATVVKIDRLFPLENCDNLLWFSVFGFTAIVSKDTKEWDVWVVFTAETRLSDEYLKNNNMYRESTLNKDKSQKWYIEANRRVRAMKLRGSISSALFMPIESLSYMCNVSELNIWDTFNEIDWVSICEKYFIEKKDNWNWNKVKYKNKRFIRIDNKTFPEHLQTEQYLRNIDRYFDEDEVTVTQKIHGTSIRMWLVKVKRKLKRYENILKSIWVKIDNMEYDYIYASRHIIKNWNSNESKDTGFYKTDVRKGVLDKYKSSLPKDYIFYWEIIWYDGDKPIQNWYTYNLNKWESELYIYRVAIVNEDGVSVDLTLQQVYELCNSVWLKVVPLLWKWKHKDFNKDEWIDKTFRPTYSNAVPLCEESVCDEWVVLRKEWLQPYVTKLKSPKFLCFETEQLDSWEIDMETNETLSSNE